MPDSIEKRVLELINRVLTKEEIEKSIIYFDSKILKKGTVIDVQLEENPKIPFDGYLLFIDKEPKANWGHPTLYYLINSESMEVKVIKNAEFPPYFDYYQSPSTFKVLLRYGKKPPDDRYFDIYD
ncbi:MAG: hypothetical protein ACFFEN_10500 [Candidatus Thorarchaeota archaeon]